MIKRATRAAALFVVASVLGSGAWGQDVNATLELIDNPDFSVALEYFGSAGGREVSLTGRDLNTNAAGTQSPFVGVRLAEPVDGSNPTIAVGNEADITFTLNGATFASTVGPHLLELHEDQNCASLTTGAPYSTASVSAGGARGESSVTFRIETIGNRNLTAPTSLCFRLPDLMVTLANVSAEGQPPMMGVSASASVVPVVTSTFPFPDAVVPNPNPPMGSADIYNGIILTAMPALTTSLGMGQTGMVDVADRTKIASGGTADPSAASADMAMMGLLVGALTVDASAGATVTQLDEDKPVAEGGMIDASLAGQIMLSVAGPFQDGDKLVVGSQAVMPSGGMASTSVAIAAGGPTNIVYVPGGSAELRPGTFTASAKYMFTNSANNNDLMIMGSMGHIAYDGLSTEGYAYGLVRGGEDATETSHVRATCESPTGCSVFMDCAGESGMGQFAGPAEVAAGATAVWSGDDIAMVLGGGWGMGPGRCEFLSTGALTVQHMVRSGHALVNSSAVVGRGLDEGTDAMHGSQLMDICASVGTAPERDANGMVTNADAVTPCHPGM